MPDPTPADRMALAMCKFGGQCEAPCYWCRKASAAVAHEIGRQPIRLITAMNILADNFYDARNKEGRIGFTTPLVDGLRPIELGDHLLVAYEEGLETQECRPLLYRTTLVGTVEYGMQRIVARQVPE